MRSTSVRSDIARPVPPSLAHAHAQEYTETQRFRVANLTRQAAPDILALALIELSSRASP